MKSIIQYINESLFSHATTHPKSQEQLFKIVAKRIKENPREPQLNDIDTSHINSMRHLFNREYMKKYYNIDTSKIEKIDISNWDTSMVKNMEGMFYKCENLSELILGDFDTSRVDDISYMFYDCECLRSIDLRNCKFHNVKRMPGMFAHCYSLRELKLPSDMRNLDVDCFRMFDGCTHSLIPGWYNKIY